MADPRIYEEIPGGTPNGVLTTFTLSQTPIAPSVTVTVNGLGQYQGNDYSVVGATIVFFPLSIPHTGAAIRVSYDPTGIPAPSTPGTSPVYVYGDVVNNVLNIARSRVKQTILASAGYPGGSDAGMQFTEAGGGSLLSTDVNADPTGSLVLRTQVIFNAAWRKLQKYLGNLGYRLLIGDNLIIPNLPPNSNPDPAAQSWLSWNGFFDGTTFHSTPALPQDFYAPLKIRERLNGQDALFTPMRCALDGLRNQFIRTVLNRQWEWRTNALYLPGATAATDLQLRYTRYLSDFPDPNYYVPNTPWYLQQLPIPGCASALAWYVAYEALFPDSEDTDAAQSVLAQAQGEADLIFNDQARADQRTNNRRRPRGGSSRGRGYRNAL